MRLSFFVCPKIIVMFVHFKNEHIALIVHSKIMMSEYKKYWNSEVQEEILNLNFKKNKFCLKQLNVFIFILLSCCPVKPPRFALILHCSVWPLDGKLWRRTNVLKCAVKSCGIKKRSCSASICSFRNFMPPLCYLLRDSMFDVSLGLVTPDSGSSCDDECTCHSKHIQKREGKYKCRK